MSSTRQWYAVVTPWAQKDLERLPLKDPDRVRVAIDVLSTGPEHGDLKKLQGRMNERRRRVGDWRVRFRPDFDARVVVTLLVLPRSSAYRD